MTYIYIYICKYIRIYVCAVHASAIRSPIRIICITHIGSLHTTRARMMCRCIQYLSRTRTRSVVKPYKGGQPEDLCPAGITENGWSSTQKETETKICPSSASDCESGQKWRNRVSNGITSGMCVDCGPIDDPNATYSNGCKNGCKSGYKISFRDNRCLKVGCTDSTAKNYDSTAQTACGDYNSDPTRQNECCEYEEIVEEIEGFED